MKPFQGLLQAQNEVSYPLPNQYNLKFNFIFFILHPFNLINFIVSIPSYSSELSIFDLYFLFYLTLRTATGLCSTICRWSRRPTSQEEKSINQESKPHRFTLHHSFLVDEVKRASFSQEEKVGYFLLQANSIYLLFLSSVQDFFPILEFFSIILNVFSLVSHHYDCLNTIFDQLIQKNVRWSH